MIRTPLALLAAMTLCAASHGDDAKVAEAARKIKAADPRIKLQAVADLAPFAADTPVAAKALCEAMVSPTRNISMAAFEAIEKGRPDLYKPIASLLLDRNVEKRMEAIADLLALGDKAAPALPILQAVFQVELKRGPDPDTGAMTDLQDLCLEAICKLGSDDPETLKLLKTVAATDHRFTAARTVALRSLMEWAGTDEKRLKEIFPTIKNGLGDPACTVLCIGYLGELGPAAKDALPLLKKLKLSSNSSIRTLAADAVAKIEKP